MKTKINRQNSKTRSFINSNPDLFEFLKQGDLVEGTVLEKSPREMKVDLGKYGTGVVYRGEIMNARSIIRDIEEGDEVQAKVVEVDNDHGFIELSLSEAQKKKSWLEIKKLYENEEVLEISPQSANKGGLIFEIKGLQAFLPASQLSPENYPNVEDGDKEKIKEQLEDMLDEKMEVKIISAEPKKDKLIVSEKKAKEESTKKLAEEYEEGQVVKGTVSGIADFGAFVKIEDGPGMEGLIHVSELSHKMVDNPKDIIEVGDEVEAKIIEIKDGKISLSLKALKEDPWESIEEEYEEGEEIEGEIYSFNPFGATVDLGQGIQGQVHVTEFGGVEEMKEELEQGSAYNFEIKEIRSEDQRIDLSMAD
ncbi:MAG: S1 RNA-binding domain-containing protein [Candidatus Magasanikbacteria bacterium]